MWIQSQENPLQGYFGIEDPLPELVVQSYRFFM